MRRGFVVGMGVLASSVLMIAVPASAQAATGVFQYTHAYTALTVKLKNPADDVCIQATANGTVSNGTDREATLYPSPACQGEPLGTLEPTATVSRVAMASVMFTSA
ncbi:hypothetical protein ACFXOM_04680 [Streptomyces sp. NPDC059169]|uniref:hypothetical protein n=1 Tax=Streptomyces sp. NPDC059169 TaxID=3346754 RepID=UPI0036B6638E